MSPLTEPLSRPALPQVERAGDFSFREYEQVAGAITATGTSSATGRGPIQMSVGLAGCRVARGTVQGREPAVIAAFIRTGLEVLASPDKKVRFLSPGRPGPARSKNAVFVHPDSIRK